MQTYKGQASVTIQAPVEAVYAYLADFTRHSEWAMNIGLITQTTIGPVGVGTTFKTAEGPPPVTNIQKIKMMVHFTLGIFGGAKPYSVAKITALEPYRRIAWEAGVPKGKGFFNFVEWEVTLEPQEESTFLTQRFYWQPQTSTAVRMVRAAGIEGLEQAVGKSLVQLKIWVEKLVPHAPSKI